MNPPSSRRARRRLPLAIVVLGSLGAILFVLPIAGLAAEAPWSSLLDLLGSPIVADALLLSLLTSVLATLLSVLLGVPLAWLLARTDFTGRSIIRSVVTLPMVLPPVVGGVALLAALGRNGMVGAPIANSTGFALPYSIWGVVAANTFVAMPFLVVTVEGALSSADQRYEHASQSLGASQLQTMRRVTVPMIAPSLRAGIVLAWARALGEFGATITFAGNLQGRTQTLPLAVFVALESDRDAALAISLVLVGVSLVVLMLMRNRWWGAL